MGNTGMHFMCECVEDDSKWRAFEMRRQKEEFAFLRGVDGLCIITTGPTL